MALEGFMVHIPYWVLQLDMVYGPYFSVYWALKEEGKQASSLHTAQHADLRSLLLCEMAEGWGAWYTCVTIREPTTRRAVG